MKVFPPEQVDMDAIRRLLARRAGRVHMLGVGGIGMAGLAALLAGRGFSVTGCDLLSNRLTEWLGRQGVGVEHGHRGSHVTEDLVFVVRSTAVPQDHEEVQKATAVGVPVFARGAVLAADVSEERSIAVSGTHGKTTTAAMIAQVLRSAGRDPSYCVGGECDGLDGVAASGQGDEVVIEADESDGTVSLYTPSIAVVTNIEFDHMEHFSDEAEMEACFASFAGRTKERVVFCADDPVARRLCSGVSYGWSDAADVRGVHVEKVADGITFDVVRGGNEVGCIRLPVPGLHNAVNALATCAAALEVGCSFEEIRAGLSVFVPVRRRFETICESKGVRVISDYAHHPSEIRAVVEMTGMMPHNRIVAVFQPHRYTRTRALGSAFPRAFKGVDHLVLAPVYAASELPLGGGTSGDLQRHFEQQGWTGVGQAETLADAWNQVRSVLQPGDIFLILGAGDVECIGEWAQAELGGERKKRE